MGSTIPRLTVEIKDKVIQTDHNGTELVDTRGKTKKVSSTSTKYNKNNKISPTVAASEPERHPQKPIHPVYIPTAAQVQTVEQNLDNEVIASRPSLPYSL